MRPFRFGVIIDARQPTRDSLVEVTRRATDAGFDIALATDHFGQHGALQVLQAVAEISPLRIGTLVLNNDMRHPVVLAHELAALDVYSGGRLEIGLGAGWSKWEYDDASMSFDRPGKRVDRLQAAVSIVKQALSTGEVNHEDGPYGAIRMSGLPLSAQRPHPPFLIGGGGPRLLGMAAREAQIVAIDPRALPEGGQRTGEAAPAVVDEKVGYIRAGAGERFDDLEISLIVFGFDPRFRGTGRPSVDAPHLTDDELVDSPYYLLGEVDAMADAVQARRERWGISYYVVNERNLEFMAAVAARLAGS